MIQVRLLRQRNRLQRDLRPPAHPRAHRVRTGKPLEQIVERPVLLHDHHDVLDLRGRRRHRNGRRIRHRRGRTLPTAAAGKRKANEEATRQNRGERELRHTGRHSVKPSRIVHVELWNTRDLPMSRSTATFLLFSPEHSRRPAVSSPQTQRAQKHPPAANLHLTLRKPQPAPEETHER